MLFNTFLSKDILMNSTREWERDTDTNLNARQNVILFSLPNFLKLKN